MKKGLLLIIMSLVSVQVWAVQNGDSVPFLLLDKIMATIGDKVILSSDIANQIADMQRSGEDTTGHSECQLLEQAIVNKAMVMQAAKDSLQISDEEVEAEMDNRIRYFMQLYGNKEALEQIAGKNIFQLKEDFREPIREGLLVRSMQQKIMTSVKTTPAEVEHFFKEQPEEMRSFYEAEFEIAQIIRYPQAVPEVEEYTIEQLKEFKRQVEEGSSKFENLAKIYSEDPGSAAQGGKYELNRGDKHWDPVFLTTAFRLKSGQISVPVKSRFGYHIIQMVSRYGDDAVVRHILKIPQIREADVEREVRFLDSVRQMILHKELSFESAVSRYTQDENSAFTGGFLMNKEQSAQLTIGELDKSVVAQISALKIGDLSKPLVSADEQQKIGVKLLFLRNRTHPHKENLQDDYLRIVAKLTTMKKVEALKKWLNTKVPTFYLHVDKPYEACSETMRQWLKNSKRSATEYSY